MTKHQSIRITQTSNTWFIIYRENTLSQLLAINTILDSIGQSNCTDLCMIKTHAQLKHKTYMYYHTYDVCIITVYI